MFAGRPDHRFTTLVVSAFAGAALSLGCSSAVPPPATVTQAAEVERVDPGPSYYEGEIGGMDEFAVEGRFKSLMRPISRCFETGSERVEQLGGSFTVAFRVDKKGATRWAYMKASTLGDRDTESCILDIVRAEAWPKPLSGEGLAEKTIEIEPSKAPHALDDKRVRAAVSAAKKRTEACRKGIRGAFFATVYLEPNGRARTAGVATPDEKGDAVADCITSEIKKLKFIATGKVAKVTFAM